MTPTTAQDTGRTTSQRNATQRAGSLTRGALDPELCTRSDGGTANPATTPSATHAMALAHGSAVDVERDISGEPFTVAELSAYVFGNNDAVVSFTCPEEDAVRYKQSHCCRIRFQLAGGRSPVALCSRIYSHPLPGTVDTKIP